MKVIFKDREWGTEIELIPETLNEVAELFRFSRNASSRKPFINQSFNEDADVPGKCFISIGKKALRNRINSVSPNIK